MKRRVLLLRTYRELPVGERRSGEWQEVHLGAANRKVFAPGRLCRQAPISAGVFTGYLLSHTL
ncbi:MAG: hypothetical protein E7293_10795 [Lachnospiraceae bacterium]|nr:hypothetical protein [Lachnospiraceae bacterium]